MRVFVCLFRPLLSPPSVSVCVYPSVFVSVSVYSLSTGVNLQFIFKRLVLLTILMRKYTYLVIFQVIDEIGRDVNRTFPSHRLFQEGGPGQSALKRVLERYAILDPAIGYCQGMGFIAALLLQYLHEFDAFYALVSLMNVSDRMHSIIVFC